MAFTHTFIYEFVTLFVVLDPVATVPVFLAVTAGLTRGHSLRVALYALGVSFVVLVFFIAGGQFLTQLLDSAKLFITGFVLALIVSPVMKAAWLEHRKTTACATSSGSPILPSRWKAPPTLLALALFPWVSSSMTRDQEIQVGKDAAAQVEREMEVIKNAEAEAWLNQIGQQLAGVHQSACNRCAQL